MFKIVKIPSVLILLLLGSSCTSVDEAQHEGKNSLLTPQMKNFISLTVGVNADDISYNPKTNRIFVPNTPLDESLDSVKKTMEFVLRNNPEFFTQNK